MNLVTFFKLVFARSWYLVIADAYFPMGFFFFVHGYNVSYLVFAYLSLAVTFRSSVQNIMKEICNIL